MRPRPAANFEEPAPKSLFLKDGRRASSVFAASRHLRRSVRHMTQHDLAPDIVTILEHLARWARGYDNHLKWNEEAKLKADLMNSRAQWLGFSAAAVRTKCIALGMREEDANLIADLVSKAQAGKRLIPKRSYREP